MTDNGCIECGRDTTDTVTCCAECAADKFARVGTKTVLKKTADAAREHVRQLVMQPVDIHVKMKRIDELIAAVREDERALCSALFQDELVSGLCEKCGKMVADGLQTHRK